MEPLRDGLIVVAKRDCPTCALIEPVYAQLAAAAQSLVVYSQDDPGFPDSLGGGIDDSALEQSYRLEIEIVPTLIRIEGGREAGRVFGWDRAEWERLSGVGGLGPGLLPESRPGCGSRTTEPGMPARLAVRYGTECFAARPIALSSDADAIEACFERGWTDGLPVVPPTRERVLEMLSGTRRDPAEVLGEIPPDYAACTVEKAAINAVMAGCRPEYLPVVMTAIEAALMPDFGLHGVLCTTNFVGPAVMVNGPVARSIGMNCKGNVFGQGNRANATIGRALQLVVRNVGGGRPGEIDRATMGNPGKYTFCFAEDEDTNWESFAVERGFAPTASTVTILVADGVTPIVDEISRTPESLARSYAACLRAIHHPKKIADVSAFLVVSPEHGRLFESAGWSKQRLKDELDRLLQIPAKELVRGAGGIEAGLAPDMVIDPDATMAKFSTGPLNIIRAGGEAGLFSAIISGLGSITINPVIKEIRP